MADANKRQTNVLLVDDDEAVIELARRAFKDIPVSVHAETSGSRALDYLLGCLHASDSEEDQVPDLIITDLNMPGMSGIEFIREVRVHSHLSNIPIVAMSTTDDPGEMDTCRRIGCTNCLTKPHTASELMKIMKQTVALSTA